MKIAQPLRRLALVSLATALAAAPAAAQKMGKWYEDAQNGYRFKTPRNWDPVPPRPEMKEFGIVQTFDGNVLIAKTPNGLVNVKCELYVFLLEAQESAEPGPDGRSVAKKRRPDLTEQLRPLGGLGISGTSPDLDETEVINKLDARHRTWHTHRNFDVFTDTWSFTLDHADVAIVFVLPADHEKDWAKLLERCAETFEAVERDTERAELGKDYDSILRYHEEEASRTPGWYVLPTPLQKYVIKTSSDDKKFLKEAISRLESSRELYERDFPPKGTFDHVSVVRVCGTREEFQSYGDSPPGVVGWFNARTTELVLYDAKNIDRNETYAVMSHEAFHQYCHFLFEESEAHRWFDEGQGDYYGGAEFRGSRVKITPQMPGGLDRLQIIRDLVRNERYVPLAKHLNFDHGEWQSHGVASYSESWSIVYMLREGMAGRVSRRVWKDEYADIIPNYVETLFAGFQEKYAEMRGKGPAEGGDDVKVNRFDLGPGEREKIWRKAMDASWGQIDLDEFEENWKLYVLKYLK